MYYFQDLKLVQLLCTIFKILNLFSYCVPFSRSQACSVIVYHFQDLKPVQFKSVYHFQDLKPVQTLAWHICIMYHSQKLNHVQLHEYSHSQKLNPVQLHMYSHSQKLNPVQLHMYSHSQKLNPVQLHICIAILRN